MPTTFTKSNYAAPKQPISVMKNTYPGSFNNPAWDFIINKKSWAINYADSIQSYMIWPMVTFQLSQEVTTWSPSLVLRAAPWAGKVNNGGLLGNQTESSVYGPLPNSSQNGQFEMGLCIDSIPTTHYPSVTLSVSFTLSRPDLLDIVTYESVRSQFTAVDGGSGEAAPLTYCLFVKESATVTTGMDLGTITGTYVVDGVTVTTPPGNIIAGGNSIIVGTTQTIIPYPTMALANGTVTNLQYRISPSTTWLTWSDNISYTNPSVIYIRGTFNPTTYSSMQILAQRLGSSTIDTTTVLGGPGAVVVNMTLNVDASLYYSGITFQSTVQTPPSITVTKSTQLVLGCTISNVQYSKNGGAWTTFSTSTLSVLTTDTMSYRATFTRSASYPQVFASISVTNPSQYLENQQAAAITLTIPALARTSNYSVAFYGESVPSGGRV